ncbi:MAG: hypothetical protein AAGI71_19660 [Bacteroidota bacterium]
MSQTLYAILALMMMATYSFNIAQKQIASQQRIITREVEEMAATVALEKIEAIRSRDFDAAVSDGRVDGDAGDLDEFSYPFTASGNNCRIFGGGNVCDDIDDFHAQQTLTEPFVFGADTVYFEVNFDVQYVDGNPLAPVSYRTFNKQVTVTVQDIWPGTTIPSYLHQPITLSRVFSYTF